MIRSRLLWWSCSLGSSAAALGVSVAVLGVAHTAVILAVVLGIGAVTVAGAEWVARAGLRTTPARISIQLATVIGLVVAPVLAALIILGLAMFVMTDDAVLVGVVIVLSGVIGVAAARRVAHGISRDVAGIRDGLALIGQGERDITLTATSAAELRELAGQASAMLERLTGEELAREQSEDARRLLIAHASHDLRTPITSLRLLAEAVDDELVDGAMRAEYVRRMLTHIAALSGLIDDLFELSRLQAGDINWTLERVAVDELLDATVAAMRTDAAARGVLVQAELPTELAAARANPERLQRVLFNLIQNAIRHSPADGTVVVRAESLADMIEVEVADHGAGIPAADRDHIFDAFYRGDAARSSDGAGLGLAVARAIIDAHGGRIWLVPEPADAGGTAGTRVRFSVPVAA